MKKRLLTLFLCLILAISPLGITVYAAAPEATGSKTEVTYFEDGSYLVTVITEDTGTSMARITNSKSGSKRTALYSSTNDLLCSLTVYGTFTYDGSSALATNSSYSYTVDSSLWSFDSGSSVKSGSKVTATATFNFLSFVQSRTISVSLACSPNGTLS